jgi:hypothetical protein
VNDDESYLSWEDQRAISRLPRELADRAPQDLRVDLLGAAADGYALVADWTAGAAVYERLRLTAEEHGLIRRALLVAKGEVSSDFDRLRVISEGERVRLASRLRFGPAPPTGDRIERFLVDYVRRRGNVEAILAAWRDGPDARTKVYCLVFGRVSEMNGIWWSAVEGLQIDGLGGRLLEDVGVALEAVAAGETWPAYHRRLVRAAAPIWVAKRFDLAALIASQPEPLVLVDLADDATLEPGPDEHDAVDAAMSEWAASATNVVRVVRAWSEGTRVFGVVVDDGTGVVTAKDDFIEALQRVTGGEVAVLVTPGPSDVAGIVVWER